jgi:transposase
VSELELEQRMNIKFLVQLGKSGNEIREMLGQVYRDNAMKKTAVYKWVKRFSEGRESVTDEERSGRPATSRTEENPGKIRQIVRENLRLTVNVHLLCYAPDSQPFLSHIVLRYYSEETF